MNITDLLLAAEPILTIIGAMIVSAKRMQSIEDKIEYGNKRTDDVLKQVEKQNGNVARLTEKNQENEIEIAVLGERLKNLKGA